MKKLLVLFIQVCISILVFNTVAFSATAENEIVAKHSIAKLSSHLISFEDYNNNTRWLSDPILLCDAYENYQFKSMDPVQKKYRTTTVQNYINQERYAFRATDSTNVTVQLSPFESLSQEINLNAEDYVSISIVKLMDFPDSNYIYRSDDTRKMKELYSDLAISGNNTTVSHGKILYRTTLNNGNYYGNWSYVNLNSMIDSTDTLVFSGAQVVQIVVIYEVKEVAPSIFQSNMFYHVRGIYGFNISAAS